MSTIDLFDNFEYCNNIPEYIKYEIKLFHCNYNSVLFVTNDDTVYGLGSNDAGGSLLFRATPSSAVRNGRRSKRGLCRRRRHRSLGVIFDVGAVPALNARA